MLQSIRDNIRGWVAWVVVIFLSIPFALFGINTYFEGTFSDNVAEVDGEEITNREFRDRYQSQLQQMRQAMGDAYDPDELDEPALRRQVLDAMIQRELIVQRADRNRYDITEERVAREIQNIPAFQENGQFSMERYRNLLRAQGMSTSYFEDQMRRDLKTDVIRSGIAESAFVTDKELDRLAALERQQRRFSFVNVQTDDFLEAVSVSDEEVEAYFEENRDDFRTDEEVELAYVELSMELARERVEISEDDLREAWEGQQDRFLEDEERMVRHILLDDEDPDAAEEKARELKSRIEEGESFEELARDYSTDPGSAEEGGSLGTVSRGDMVDEVDEVIFELEEGVVSDPVRSQFGFHLIRVDEILAREPVAFEDARNELEEDLRERRAEEIYFDLREALADEAFQNPEDIAPLADILGVDVQSLSGVTRDSGEGIAEYSEVRREAFSDIVLNEGFNSDPIELDDDRVVVIRVMDHKPAERRELAEVRDEVEDHLRREKARERARDEARGLLEQARETGDLAGAAADRGLEASEARWIERQDPGVDTDVRDRVFRLGRPGEGARVELMERDEGLISVLALLEVRDEELVELDEQERTQQRMMRARQLGMSELDAYIRELWRVSDVDVLLDEEEDPFDADEEPVNEGAPPPDMQEGGGTP